MNKKAVPGVSLSQIEEALEERVNSDRRQKNQGLPEGVLEDRRKGDRRRSDPKTPPAE